MQGARAQDDFASGGCCPGASWQVSVWTPEPGFCLRCLDVGAQFGLFIFPSPLFAFTKAVLWNAGKLKGCSEQFDDDHANMPAVGKQ